MIDNRCKGLEESNRTGTKAEGLSISNRDAAKFILDKYKGAVLPTF
jgi:hypothetical protein